jgi:glucose-1-phosphate adenylyltransferase
MDYNQMLDVHLKNKADVTIAVTPVPWLEASRFGIMNTNEAGRILEFEEKPAEPKSNLASMGVYIFNWSLLREYLIQDEATPTSTNDFGKDLIPKLLQDQKKLYSFRFEGYWKDVGTIKSLWEAHMDLLEENPSFDLFDPGWKTYAGNANHPPQYISPEAKVRGSLVNEGCQIYGEVTHSVIAYGVQVGRGAVVKDAVIMPGAVIGENARVERAIIAGVIPPGEHIGSDDPEAAIALFYNNEKNLEKHEMV